MAADEATLEKADKAINDTGFVTEKEIPELKDRDYARDLGKDLEALRTKKEEKGYIYAEPFDFAEGKITSIIWNFDKIDSREGAKEALADDMGLTIIKDQLSAADKKTF